MSAHELKFCSNSVCPGVNAAALTVWRGDDSREAMNVIDVLLGLASPVACMPDRSTITVAKYYMLKQYPS